MKHEKCPHCNTAFIKQIPDYEYALYKYDLYCEKCDIYFVSRWETFRFKDFMRSEMDGKKVRRRRSHLVQFDADKPAPYCQLYYHKPQIILDPDFHQLFEHVKALERKRLQEANE